MASCWPSGESGPSGGRVTADDNCSITPETTLWHPRAVRLHRYWLSIHPSEGLLPGRQHFDPLAMPDLLAGLWLLDAQQEPFRLRYRLVGTGIVEALGRDVTGLWLDEAHPHVRDDAGFFERYPRTVETRLPDWRKGKSRLWAHRDYGSIENLLLPLARDGRKVDMLIALTVLYRPDGSAV